MVVSNKGIQDLDTRLLAIRIYFKLFGGDVKPLIMRIRSHNVEDGFLRSNNDIGHMCCAYGYIKHRNMDHGYHNMAGDNRINCIVCPMAIISGQFFDFTTKCKLVDIIRQIGYVVRCETILMEIVNRASYLIQADEKFVSVRDFGGVMASNKVEDATYVHKCIGRQGIERRRSRFHMYALLAAKIGYIQDHVTCTGKEFFSRIVMRGNKRLRNGSS